LLCQDLSNLGHKCAFFTSEGKADSKTLTHVPYARPALHSLVLISIAPPVAGGIRKAFHIDGCQPFPEVSTLHELTNKQTRIRDFSKVVLHYKKAYLPILRTLYWEFPRTTPLGLPLSVNHGEASG
jgi:hypothetical protein